MVADLFNILKSNAETTNRVKITQRNFYFNVIVIKKNTFKLYFFVQNMFGVWAASLNSPAHSLNVRMILNMTHVLNNS